jgi:hypothetical protein
MRYWHQWLSQTYRIFIYSITTYVILEIPRTRDAMCEICAKLRSRYQILVSNKTGKGRWIPIMSESHSQPPPEQPTTICTDQYHICVSNEHKMCMSRSILDFFAVIKDSRIWGSHRLQSCSSTLKMKAHIPPKHTSMLIFTRLHGVISQETELFGYRQISSLTVLPKIYFVVIFSTIDKWQYTTPDATMHIAEYLLICGPDHRFCIAMF